jgi:hypothetical protein
MWTFDCFPKAIVERHYAVRIDDGWLDHVRLSSAILANGCSASFVSPSGLVMTNQHCLRSCLAQASTPGNDLVERGFVARARAQELRCPEMEVARLLAISDVTDRIRRAGRGLVAPREDEAMRAEISRVQEECEAQPDVSCRVVILYHGGLYQLDRYQRFDDVRLVFAPEVAIAYFGGDGDNFTFPRHSFDVGFLRVYRDGKPLTVEHHLRWATAGARDGEVTFVSGNPASTSRRLTIDQLAYRRDVGLPDEVAHLTALSDLLVQYQRRGIQQRRRSAELLASTENTLKSARGQLAALRDRSLFSKLDAQERKLREAVRENPVWQRDFGGVWTAIEEAGRQLRAVRTRYNLLEASQGFLSVLFGYARLLVRAADEKARPAEKRLTEFGEAEWPAIEEEIRSNPGTPTDLEIATLTYSLTRLQSQLDAEDPLVKRVLDGRSPASAARWLIGKTKLRQVSTRMALWRGGQKAVAQSNDVLIRLAALVDGDARAARVRYEAEVEAPMRKNQELLDRARSAVLGTSTYPDGTSSLRLSVGRVRGWREGDRAIAPFTHVGELFRRDTGHQPFALPVRWLSARGRLDDRAPLDFVTDNDSASGSSGSPVINPVGDVVGVVFDGNMHTLGSHYVFDDSLHRTVAVHGAAILEVLDKVYKALNLTNELRVDK